MLENQPNKTYIKSVIKRGLTRPANLRLVQGGFPEREMRLTGAISSVSPPRVAVGGFCIAQYELGFMYEGGLGVAQDYSEAVRLSREAVDQGNAKAQLFLGIMYVNGRGGLAVSLGES